MKCSSVHQHPQPCSRTIIKLKPKKASKAPEPPIFICKLTPSTVQISRASPVMGAMREGCASSISKYAGFCQRCHKKNAAGETNAGNRGWGAEHGGRRCGEAGSFNHVTKTIVLCCAVQFGEVHGSPC